ncbi:MAG: TonB-dependent receptor, partial [candidate division Zixibacteria bacterium]|nr:TonB-dependent receptor [candidate division Zixibacteria bacterium]
TDLKLSFNPGAVFVSMQTRWVSERYIRRANTKALGKYSVTDLMTGVNQKIGKFEISLSAEMDNLFSAEYEIIERYPLPERSYGLGLGLTYNFESGGKNEK